MNGAYTPVAPSLAARDEAYRRTIRGIVVRHFPAFATLRRADNDA